MGRILVHVTLRQTYIQWGVFGEELGGIGQELFPCLCRGEVVHLLSVPGRNLRIPGVKDKVLLKGHRTEVVGVSKGLLLIPVGVFLLQGKYILFTFLNNLLVFCTMRLCAFFCYILELSPFELTSSPPSSSSSSAAAASASMSSSSSSTSAPWYSQPEYRKGSVNEIKCNVMIQNNYTQSTGL